MASIHPKVTPSTPVIVVQGGAGKFSKFLQNTEQRAELEVELSAAAREGYAVLTNGGSAVDAVEAAVVFMENSPHFNAGKGSHFTEDKTIEMDALIMDGSTLNTGAVVCITNVMNPVKVARLVMDKSPHVLLVGEGARRFASKHGVQSVPTDQLVTVRAQTLLEKSPTFNPNRHMQIRADDEVPQQKEKEETYKDDRDEHDTVGAVALDQHGNLACATSTGGMTGKMVGRAGDSGIAGCGGYADNASGAISTTGHGEAFIKTCAAKHIAYLMEQGESPQKATEVTLQQMLQRVEGRGGCVTLNRHGDVGIYFTYEGMQWVAIKKDELSHGVFPGECFRKTL